MPKINLFLTFDYELPLGGWTVPPEKALIEPTNKILEICEKLQVSAVFFVDALCFVEFRRLNFTFEKLVRKQLAEIVKKGHDIQLHLHPHWITSRFENGTYTPSKDFTLSKFVDAEITNMVKQSVDYLNEIIKPINPNYKCLAFRAGGYNLENSPLTFRILEQYGVQIDSSICHNYYFASDISTVDYRNLSKQSNWFFSDGKYNKSASSGIYEIPIAGKKKSIFEMPTFIKTKIYKDRTPQYRGKTIHLGNNLSFLKKTRKAMSSRMLSFDNYTYSPRFLLKILNYNLKKFRKQEEINLAVIGHPKSMDWYNFKLMEDFIVLVRKMYGDKVGFTTFQKYWRWKEGKGKDMS